MLHHQVRARILCGELSSHGALEGRQNTHDGDNERHRNDDGDSGGDQARTAGAKIRLDNHLVTSRRAWEIASTVGE